MKATNSGNLRPIEQCYINIPGASQITMRSLPELSDSKEATYNSEGIIGRSFPLYTYSHSNDRSISMQIHFFVLTKNDAVQNLSDLKAIQSAVYPQEGGGGAPYMPPPICTMKCGDLLADSELSVIMKSYSVKFPTEVTWVETEGGMYCPVRFDVDTTWLVVYTSADLPFASRIVLHGR